MITNGNRLDSLNRTELNMSMSLSTSTIDDFDDDDNLWHDIKVSVACNLKIIVAFLPLVTEIF
jgi:hypothetical protein